MNFLLPVSLFKDQCNITLYGIQNYTLNWKFCENFSTLLYRLFVRGICGKISFSFFSSTKTIYKISKADKKFYEIISFRNDLLRGQAYHLICSKDLTKLPEISQQIEITFDSWYKTKILWNPLSHKERIAPMQKTSRQVEVNW